MVTFSKTLVHHNRDFDLGTVCRCSWISLGFLGFFATSHDMRDSSSLRGCVPAQSLLRSCPVASVVSDSLRPVDCSPPGSSVCETLQARTREWVAMASSRGSSQPRDGTRISCFLCWQAGSLPLAPPGKPQTRPPALEGVLTPGSQASPLGFPVLPVLSGVCFKFCAAGSVLHSSVLLRLLSPPPQQRLNSPSPEGVSHFSCGHLHLSCPALCPAPAATSLSCISEIRLFQKCSINESHSVSPLGTGFSRSA